jgi:hypothetical protein
MKKILLFSLVIFSTITTGSFVNAQFTSKEYFYDTGGNRTQRLTPDFYKPTTQADVQDLYGNVVYPNVVDQELNLKLSDDFIEDHPAGIVEMYDLNGKLIFNKDYSSLSTDMNFDFSDLPNGVYILKLFNQNYLQEWKIVK